MEALDAIRARRSVRRYTDAPVSDEDIDTVLRLALLAPTGHNAQAWSFVVVREPERRAALAELVLRGAAEYFAVNRPRGERSRGGARRVGGRLRRDRPRQLPGRAGVDRRPQRPPLPLPRRRDEAAHRELQRAHLGRVRAREPVRRRPRPRARHHADDLPLVRRRTSTATCSASPPTTASTTSRRWDIRSSSRSGCGRRRRRCGGRGGRWCTTRSGAARARAIRSRSRRRAPGRQHQGERPRGEGARPHEDPADAVVVQVRRRAEDRDQHGHPHHPADLTRGVEEGAPGGRPLGRQARDGGAREDREDQGHADPAEDHPGQHVREVVDLLGRRARSTTRSRRRRRRCRRARAGASPRGRRAPRPGPRRAPPSAAPGRRRCRPASTE